MSLPEPVLPHEPGARFLAEIREQPQALRRLLEHDDEFARVAAAARERAPLVRFVGHGSSDNAATYGVYAFGLLARCTALRDSIALTVYFDADFDLSGLDGDRALAVRPHPGRRRVPAPCAEARRVHGRDHERSCVRDRRRRGSRAAARRRARARGRRDEDVSQPGRGAGAARRAHAAGTARGSRTASTASPIRSTRRCRRSRPRRRRLRRRSRTSGACS